MLLGSIVQSSSPLASALSSSDAQQVKGIVRQELRNMFNLGDSTSNAISGEIQDENLDWVNTTSFNHTVNGERSTDISIVNYVSNGKTLNATLWTYFPFKANPTKYEQVNYGMLIDSDFDKNTGYGGIDYNLEYGWNNKTQSWSITLYQWSLTGERTIVQKRINYTSFFSETGPLRFSLDLNHIGHHDTYKVAFYAETKSPCDSSWITDFTRWITFPPLSIDISTLPPFLALRPGEQKTIAVRLNSTTGYEPEVSLNVIGQPGIKTNIEFNKFRIPSYGMIVVPMTISASKDALIRPYTLIIFANSTLAPDETCKTVSLACSFQSKIGYPNVLKQFSIALSVQPPLTLLEELVSGTVNPQVAAGLYGLIITPVIAWLVPRILESVNVRRQRINPTSIYE
jgi:hypothetical protein